MEYEHKIGWLDPSGTMIECGHSDHIATARTLVNLYHYQNPDRLPEDDVLLKHGWVHVTVSLLGNREWCIWWENRLTDYQKKIIFALILKKVKFNLLSEVYVNGNLKCERMQNNENYQA